MGEAIVQADKGQIATVIDEWKFDSFGSVKHSKNALCVVSWRCQSADSGTTLRMKVRPRWYVFLILHLFLFAGLWYTIQCIQNIVHEYSNLKLLHVILSSIFVVLLIWWKDKKLSLKLSKIENSFWQKISSTYDTRQLTRADGQLYIRRMRLPTEILLSCALIYIGFTIVGTWGAIILGILCIPILIMILAETLRNSYPHWHWRFWIMSNMAQWTFLMLTVLVMVPVLLVLEIFMNAELYKKEQLPLITEVIMQGSFRDISPASAQVLEQDAIRRLDELAQKGAVDSKGAPSVIFFRYAYGLILFVLFLIAISAFVILPLFSLLSSQKIWRHSVNQQDAAEGPFVPYLPQAWNWKTPPFFRALIFLHYTFGGILNIFSAIFCFDGLSYLFFGQTLLIEKAAHLWSWIFAANKIVFGNAAGQFVSAVFVCIIAASLLMLIAAYLRRFIQHIILVARVLLCKRKQKPLQAELCELCAHTGCKQPLVLVNRSQNIAIHLHYLAGKAVIELSQGTLELLDPDELKAVIAHELGHIQQGLWRISILKFLSSLALFPNHYLTLCLNWSRYEIEADAFAVQLLHDTQSLKQAIIKITTAQAIPKTIQKRWRILACFATISIAMRFYFGDALFGYAHPYLSERLTAIDTHRDRQYSECLEN